MTSKKDWLQSRADEVAQEQTGHDFYDLGPHLQLMCYMIAEEDWIDYYSSQREAESARNLPR